MNDSHPATQPGDDDGTFDLAADAQQHSKIASAPDPDGDAFRIAQLRERVYATLLKHTTIQPQLAWGLIGGGAGILLVVGCVFSFVLMIVTAIIVGDDGPGVRFFLWLYLAAMVPLLVWEERRTRGGFFTLAQADVDLTRDPDNVGDLILSRSKAHLTSIVDGLMWAPRAIVAGYRALRGIRQTGLDRVLPEAADVLTLMLSMDGGVKIVTLAPPGEDPMQLMPVLKWLDTHDYIGTSTRGDRVWVSTFARKRLIADHGAAITLPPPRAVK